MRKIKIAGSILLLCAAVESPAATDGVITWTLTTTTPVIDPSIPGDQYVTWYSAVTVTGNNQGLGGFTYNIEVRDAANNLANTTLEPASWQMVFGVAGSAGKPAEGAGVNDPGALGGAGMNVFALTGTSTSPGKLEGLAAYYLTWDPWRPDTSNPSQWTGTQSWGVGLASRKDYLLLDPAGNYDIQWGRIPVAGLPAGTYTVSLIPTNGVVLNNDLDLSQPLDQSVTRPATSQGDSFTFQILSTGGGGGGTNNAPTAVLSASPTSGAVPLTVSFSAAGSSDPDPGNTLNYAWAFGDGHTAAGAEVSHTYTTAGTYTVTLTVSDGNGGIDTETTTITVNPATVENTAPTAAITAEPTSGSAPLTVSFSAAGSSDPDGDTLSYAWDFGDGTTATDATPSHTYTSAATYTVTLTVTDGRGGSDTRQTTIVVSTSGGNGTQPPADNGGITPPLPLCGFGVVEGAAFCLMCLTLQAARRGS